MFNNKANTEGQLLKIERLRQGKELKEVVGGICSVSTLSKIERGKQKANPDMLVDLYNELGINYENNEDFMENMSNLINQYFYELTYQFEHESLNILKQESDRLMHSPMAIEWMIIRAMEYPDEDILKVLDGCVGLMSQEQLAWYYLIQRYESKNITLEKKIKAQRILQNSISTLNLMWTYWNYGEYSTVNNLSEIAINFALNEGNTWALSQVYLILGGIYSSYNMEESMISEYQKCINLLKNTNWIKELETMYYNMGATYISLGEYKKAREYLGKADKNNFSSSHKWAVLEIKTGNVNKAKKWIDKMEIYTEDYKFRNSPLKTWDKFNKSYYEEMMEIVQVTKLQLNEQAEELDKYILLLESLMNKFLKSGRYGFMNFHKDSLKEAYIKKRRYKDALELEELFSKIKTKHIVKT